jgi:hypothetical protein
MTAKLATIDWHLLGCEGGDIAPVRPSRAIPENAQPIWAHLLVIGENRYRVGSSSNDADGAWQKIVDKLLGEHREAAQAIKWERACDLRTHPFLVTILKSCPTVQLWAAH